MFCAHSRALVNLLGLPVNLTSLSAHSNKMAYRLFLILGIFYFFICAGSAHASSDTKSITIAAEDNWQPYSYLGPTNAEPLGFAPELVREVFKTKGVTVNYQTMPYTRCMHLAKSGQVTGCFNTNKHGKYNDDYYWHVTPLFDEGVSVFALADSSAKNMDVKDLEGSTVGVTLGYSYASNIMSNAKITKLEATSDTSQFKLLVAKRINFALVNTLPGQVLINGDPTLSGKIKIVGVLSVHGFYMNFTKNEHGKAMAELFEDGMREFKNSGKYDRLYAQFLKRSGLSNLVK